MDGLPPISWAALGLIVVCVMTAGGAIIAVLSWIYRESNRIRDALFDARKDMSALRIEIAQTYVSANTMREIEARLERTVNTLGERLDRSIENLLGLLRSDAIAHAKLKKVDE